MSRAPSLLASLVLLVLAACGSTQHSLGLSADEVAVVVGRERGFDLIPLGLDGSISFLAIDGEELPRSALSGAPRTIELLPGRHQVEVYYTFYVDGSPGPQGETTLELEVEAGKRYRVVERFTEGGVELELVPEPEAG